jgi:hypothetical protein
MTNPIRSLLSLVIKIAVTLLFFAVLLMPVWVFTYLNP